jgi:2-methylcitrate dehydratase PrpD
MAGESTTWALVAATRELVATDIPEEAREAARHCLLDFLGCALAGSREPLTSILVDSVVRQEGAVEASLIGRSERATRLGAALVNGAAGHALDFDDTHTTMTGHPSVPVLPALLALGETEGVSGLRLSTALVTGIELECRLGALLGADHYQKGFHGTGTLGTFGAAAGCAQMLGLDESGWLHAVGLAGTQAAGLKASFGTMAKPLHAGRAASAGLLAALLARGGFTGHGQIIETSQGFAATQATRVPDPALLDAYRHRFLIRDTLFKYHAACYLTHAAIEAANDLRARHGIEPATLDGLEVHVSPLVLDVCNITEPTTGLEGKFSLRATVALALLGEDTRNPATYSDASMADPRLVAVRDRVTVRTDDSLVPTQARVVVRTGTRRVEAVADTGVPAPDLGAQRERLLHKFRVLAAPALGGAGAERLSDAVLRIDELESVAELLRLAQPA